MKLEGAQSVILTAAQITSAARVFEAVTYASNEDIFKECFQQCCCVDPVLINHQISPGMYKSVPNGVRVEGVEQMLAFCAERDVKWRKGPSAVKQVTGRLATTKLSSSLTWSFADNNQTEPDHHEFSDRRRDQVAE